MTTTSAPPERPPPAESPAARETPELAAAPAETLGDDAWDAFAAGHPESGTGHLAAVRRLAVETGGARDVSVLVRDGERIAGLLPLFEVREPVLRWAERRFVVSGPAFPAGPLLAPWLPAKRRAAAEALLHEHAERRARELGADVLKLALPGIVGARRASEMHPVSPFLRHGYATRTSEGTLLDLSPDLAELTRQKVTPCAGSIKRCQREPGVTAGLIERRDEWTSLHDLSRRYEAPNQWPRAHFEMSWERLFERGAAVAAAVRRDGEILAAAAATIHRGAAYYWLGFAQPGNPVHGASNLALWTAILAARERGVRAFEMGSLRYGPGREAAISHYKRTFGGAPYFAWTGVKELRPVRRAAIELVQAAVDTVRGPGRQ